LVLCSCSFFYHFLGCRLSLFFFFFNDTATTEIYTLSLHDALPIYLHSRRDGVRLFHRTSAANRPRILADPAKPRLDRENIPRNRDRKSTRLNSSHSQISYAVFCLKKKKKKKKNKNNKEKKKKENHI